MKNNYFVIKIFAATLSGLLWGFAFHVGLQSLLAFVAFVPLFWLISKSKNTHAYIFPLFSALLSVLIADVGLWQRMPISDASLYITIQSSIFYFPWFLYQLVRSRHNQKLAYIAIVCSWLTMEWGSSQIFGPWQALQLGFAPAILPETIQWYAVFGATAGSVWVLSINIQVFRIIWPSKSFTRKFALFNGAFVLILPLLYYFISPEDKSVSKDSILLCTDKNFGSFEKEHCICWDCNSEKDYPKYLRLKGKPAKGIFYNSQEDTISYVYLKTENNNEKQFYSENLMTVGIGGNTMQSLNKIKFAGFDFGLMNNSVLIRPESLRLLRSQSQILISSYYEKEKYPDNIRKVISVRAIENGISIIAAMSDKTAYISAPSGRIKKINLNDNIQSFQPSLPNYTFYARYGDLTGRLSIFISIWMLLGAIVKPFRKK